MDWDIESFHQWVRLSLSSAKLKRAILQRPQQNSNENNGLPTINPLGDLPKDWLTLIPEVPMASIHASWQWLTADTEQSRGVWLIGQNDYPNRLKEIGRPPWMLFWEGNASLVHSPQLAIVGSRKASPVSLLHAEQFSEGLGRSGFTITSGLALGIDNKAHWTALQNNQPTCAVLGCGLDYFYPPRAKELQKKIQERGLLVSEYLPGTLARAAHFPARNRIISGLSLGVLVVTAARKSGSLMTANFAKEQGREVFVIPHALNDPGGQGCHWLIQQGAKLVTCVEDILCELPFSDKDFELQPESGVQMEQEFCLEGLEKPKMLVNVGFEVTSIEQIIAQSQSTVAETMNDLLQLELDGWIQSVPGGYVRLRRKADV